MPRIKERNIIEEILYGLEDLNRELFDYDDAENLPRVTVEFYGSRSGKFVLNEREGEPVSRVELFEFNTIDQGLEFVQASHIERLTMVSKQLS